MLLPSTLPLTGVWCFFFYHYYYFIMIQGYVKTNLCYKKNKKIKSSFDSSKWQPDLCQNPSTALKNCTCHLRKKLHSI